MPADLHQQLAIQYEVSVWVADSESEVCLNEVRAGLHVRRPPKKMPAQLTYRRLFDAGPARVRVPGACFHAARSHFARVVARYFFGSGGLPVPEAEAGGCALVSAEPFVPTDLGLPRPCIEPFIGPFAAAAEAGDRCAVISVHGVSAREIGVEMREGQVFAAGAEGSEAAVTPAQASWSPCKVSRLGPEADGGQRLLLSGLAPRVCQFRLAMGVRVSEPTGWCDTEVWAPPALRGAELVEQMTGLSSAS
ncbi:unnamed protein product, partial [Prorocentrum cordatum]